jgi:excisionase family DNA binding protein
MKNSNKFYNINHTVFISLPIEDLQTVIIDCVNSCLKNNTQESKPTTEQPEQLLIVQEAAQFLNLTVPTIYSKVSKGELPVMKRSKRLYFSKYLNLWSTLKRGVKITINAGEQRTKIMITITKWGSKELEIGTEFDQEQELELTMLDNVGGDASVWLKKEEVKRLIEHLQNVL